MMYYFIVFLAVGLISLGVILIRKPFFAFAYTTSALLNSMLESGLDEAKKRKKHLRSLKEMILGFGLLLFLIVVVLGTSFIPIWIFTEVKNIPLSELDTSSFYFILSMILGSFVLFIFPKKQQNKDYTEWSMLLHRMILDNYNLSRALFKFEKWIYRRQIKTLNDDFVIVTGLARGGTTALTNLLFESQKFHSLSYDNMPFLLSVNLWKKIYHPRKNKLKERAHGDNILFGYKTIEALEEYFFKVFLKDGFISDDILKKHSIDQETYTSYIAYQNLIGLKNGETTYIAKNNNLILRYESLRAFNPHFKIILIFRSPDAHAYSLMNQHKRFSELHQEDPFSLEYMNWLGHHEFGMNHKIFDLMPLNANQYDYSSIDHWVASWINYYTHVLTLVEDEKLFLVDYSDLCNHPEALLESLGKKLKLDLSVGKRKPYEEQELPDLHIDSALEKRANAIHIELKLHKIQMG